MTAKIEMIRSALENYLSIWHYQWASSKHKRIGDLCLEPTSHVATATQCYGTDTFLLSPSHPLLLIYYGMIFEAIVIKKRECSREVVKDYAHAALWGTLKHRFGAFLYQQEMQLVKVTLGEVIIPT